MDDPRDTRPLAHPGRGQLLKFPKTDGAREPAEADANDAPSAARPSSADLFALLWLGLADVLGTAAAATLLRRAAQRAGQASPEIVGLEITRATLEYQYKVPEAWNKASSEPPQALCDLVRELWTLLVELTGSVVVARLLQIDELRERGIVPPREPQP